MASSHSRRRSLTRVALSICLVVFLITTFASAASSPSASPSAESELICPTDNPAECYPKVFSATNEFQLVHDDQDLPPGLHVQLDMQTGQKQAKLYDPKEDNPALEGLPVDQAVVVVDPESSQDQPQIPRGAPAYEPVGIVKVPEHKDEGFTEALRTLKTEYKRGEKAKVDILDQALELLEELSHDMYYGKEIIGDTDAVEVLFCLLMKQDVSSQESRPLTERPDFQASSILASSIRNNPHGLRELEKSWDDVMSRRCKFHSHSLRDEFYRNISPQSLPNDAGQESEADFLRLKLAVLGGMLKSPQIRTEFMEKDGMKKLLELLLREGQVWDARKSKAAQIISDVFLDEEVGATLGVWPTKGVADAAICSKGDTESLDEGCWEYHLEKISQSSADDGWSKSLLTSLRQRRPGATASEKQYKRDEL